ncbi:hypothetical protein BpHYR1_011511 [Brachionus plicatilis]|uniref:Uncharacterized protein n=1 Tax=Brachionus plicatilis TaxID=10195 RepID=A0A3M7S4R2_BRAPC|nr:hypothetical protein BpHYR1_011511 [Brachionus plicatilis]
MINQSKHDKMKGKFKFMIKYFFELIIIKIKKQILAKEIKLQREKKISRIRESIFRNDLFVFVLSNFRKYNIGFDCKN